MEAVFALSHRSSWPQDYGRLIFPPQSGALAAVVAGNEVGKPRATRAAR